MKKTIASLEGLRGCAALLVVIFHIQFAFPGAHWFEGGYLAVDLFFVLSGFVIATAYGDRISDGASWRTFMIRRFGRLYPAQLVASVAMYAVLNGCIRSFGYLVTANPPSATPADIFAVVTMTQGMPIYYRVVGLPVTWSTSCEFFVYMLFAALCVTVHGRIRVAIFSALAIVGYVAAIVASIVKTSCISDGGCFDLFVGYGWARCFAGFFLGSIMAYYRDKPFLSSLERPLTQWLALAIAVAIMLLCARAYRGVSLSVAAFGAPCAFAILVASLSHDSGPVARLFSLRPFQWLGEVSYSVYLTHGIFRVPLNYLALHTTHPALLGSTFILVSYFAAQAMHMLIEKPCRERIYSWSNSIRDKSPATTFD
ncbi:acyltransferase family protein [Burkholderia sp. IMCC1007]|uniref:acyltransferase family protein n=1 Tax=Burkholderia sp. IMCC1007 TaxID=3004104 RepID=UPI0022B40C68|nr:acyltransferase [Burkholderia sp. IMCC1007]